MKERLPRIGAVLFLAAGLFALVQVPPVYEATTGDPHHPALQVLGISVSTLLLAFGTARVRPRPNRARLFRYLMLLPILQAALYFLLASTVLIEPLTGGDVSKIGGYLLAAALFPFFGGFLLASPLYLFADRAGWLLAAEFLGPAIWFLAILIPPLL